MAENVWNDSELPAVLYDRKGKGQMENKKLAVLFPGIGYTCMKPLLYYTAQAAQAHGYEILRLDYGEDIHAFRGRTEEELQPLYEMAVGRVMKTLRSVNWEIYQDILFISKSIGTAVACETARQLKLDALQFLMTPIRQTLSYLGMIRGCFVAGTADPVLDVVLLQKAAEEYPDKAGIIFEGCNHSLEKKDDTAGNIHRLGEVVELMERLLTEENKKQLIQNDHRKKE